MRNFGIEALTFRDMNSNKVCRDTLTVVAKTWWFQIGRDESHFYLIFTIKLTVIQFLHERTIDTAYT